MVDNTGPLDAARDQVAKIYWRLRGSPATPSTAPIVPAQLDAAVAWIDRISLWLLCAGALALPLVYLRDTHDEFVLPKVLFAQLLLVSLLALCAARWAAAGALTIRRSPLDLPILAFLASALVSTIFAENRNVALFGTYIRYEGLLTLATYAGLFWLATQTAWTSDRARTLIRSVLASGYAVSIVAVVQWVIAALTTSVPSELTGFSYGGLPRASATFSNPTMLAAFLAMLLPVAAGAFFEARSLTGRILAANATFVMSVALVLTFTRSAWLGALAGLLIVVAAPQPTPLRMRLALSGAGLAVVLAVVAGGALARGGLPLVPWLVNRVVSIQAIPGQAIQGIPSSSSVRLRVWEGTFRLIASRPVVGYGPDTFGMVYPRFRTGDWTPGFTTDKAHSELLQIAATQGLLGVASYLWIIGASAMAFWRGRGNQGAAAAFGGVVAYQLWAQANFSWVPAAAPYWLFLAAASTTWKGDLPTVSLVRLPRTRGLGLALAVIVGLGLIGLTAAGTARARSAEAYFQFGLAAEARGDLGAARAALARARSLGPEQSQYALEAGTVALRSTDLGQGRWLAANEAFSDAARLGTYYSAVYYDLALTDIQLGRQAEAMAALGKALRLSPGDPASLALLNQLNGT